MTTIAVGNQRLLKLADILDAADAAHKNNGEPTYDQSVFAHDCNTPACALGHWVAANPRRWFRNLNAPRLRKPAASVESYAISHAAFEFALEYEDAQELFEWNGCKNARTGKQAAKYIRRFVERRS